MLSNESEGCSGWMFGGEANREEGILTEVLDGPPG